MKTFKIIAIATVVVIIWTLFSFYFKIPQTVQIGGSVLIGSIAGFEIATLRMRI